MTTLYVPVSLYSHHTRTPSGPPLSAGAIAGVVIAGVVVGSVLGFVVFAVVSRYAYRYLVVRDVDDSDPTKGGAAYNLDPEDRTPAPDNALDIETRVGEVAPTNITKSS